MQKMKIIFPVILMAVFVWAQTGFCATGDENLDEAAKARIAKAEQGPASIDVSAYPQKIQDIYTDLFSQKCTQCHRLSRPVNSDYALPSEWDGYVKKMMHKSGSNINMGEARKITEFLIYDSSVRKKALVDDKLSKEAADAKAADEARIKQVHDKYDH